MEKPNTNDELTLKGDLLKVKRLNEMFQVYTGRRVEPGRYFLHHMIVPDPPNTKNVITIPKSAEVELVRRSVWWKAYVSQSRPRYYPINNSDVVDIGGDAEGDSAVLRFRAPYSLRGLDWPEGFWIIGTLFTDYGSNILVHSKEKMMNYLASIAAAPIKVWPVDRDGNPVTETPITVYNIISSCISVF